MIKPLTSLRFFFAICVFLSHYSINGNVLFTEGYIGVEFFFILSGFILTYNYKQRLINKQITNREFYIARFARIYPLHLLLLLFVVLLTLIRIIRHSGIFHYDQFIANALLLQSFIPNRDFYFSFNAVSWSISDEMFFYALFPFIISFICQFTKQYLISCVTIGLICYIVMTLLIPEGWQHALFYINPVFRIYDFTIGIGLYYVWEKLKDHRPVVFRKIILTGIEIISIGLLVIMVIISKNIPQVFRYASYYWIPMSLIILVFARPSNGGIHTVLSWKPFVVLGEISFGFYMLHQKIIEMISLNLKKIYVDLPEGIIFILILSLVLFASFLSFYFFEKRMNLLIKKCMRITLCQ